MKTCRVSKRYSGEKGVAIVVVLGLIAVLMLMAVAFSIHMRIERTGAANYRYGVQARHMIYAGLANAVEDIHDLMGGSGNPEIYPDWDVVGSTGGSSRASVLSASTAEYLPEPLRKTARTQMAKWKSIKDDNGIQRGRYAFVILNSSGLLDANRVAQFDRGKGTNSLEIQLDPVSCVTDPIAFGNRAATDYRYENLPELVSQNEYAGDGRSFAMFSLTPIDKYYDIDGELGDRVRIENADPSSWNQAEFKAALARAGVTQVDRVFRNMQDWVDDDCVPRKLDESCGEAVPMVNEASLTNDITVTGAQTFEWRWEAAVELFYPFEEKSENSFNAEVEVEWSAGAGMTHPEMLPANRTETLTINTPTRRWIVIRSRVRPHTGMLSDTNAVNLDATCNIKVRVMCGSDVVDEVPSPYAGSSPISFRLRGALPFGATQSSFLWAECVDPRFNWARSTAAGASGPMWEMSDRGGLTAPSMGAENLLTLNVLSGGDSRRKGNYDGPSDTYAYVGDRAFSRVGELGTIVMAPWTTLRLYDHGFPTMHNGEKEYHKVLDYFRVYSNDWRRGCVNINSTNSEVIAAAFSGCPSDEDDATSASLIYDQAGAQNDSLDLAEELISGQPYTNVASIGDAGVVDWEAYATAMGTDSSDFEREALIRNTAELLTARHNLFTVIVRADSFSEGMGGDASKGMTLASARAVAEIWRDPIPDENGRNRCLIRSFRFIED